MISETVWHVSVATKAYHFAYSEHSKQEAEARAAILFKHHPGAVITVRAPNGESYVWEKKC